MNMINQLIIEGYCKEYTKGRGYVSFEIDVPRKRRNSDGFESVTHFDFPVRCFNEEVANCIKPNRHVRIVGHLESFTSHSKLGNDTTISIISEHIEFLND